MKGLLIYNSTGAKRNRWFIERLLYNFKQKGINLELVITDNNELGTINNVDFAIVRVAAPEINKSLENFGVRVFNNFNTSYIANNKWETYLLCKRLGIPTMPTYHNLENKELCQFPCVLKSDNGHGGSEVFWVNNVEEFLTIERQFQLINKNFVIQKPSSELGKDMRIYLMGQEIVSSV